MKKEINNNIFHNMGYWSHLLFLCFFSFGGLIIGAFMSLFVGRILGVEIVESFDIQSLTFVRLSQIIQVVFWLLIPASIYISLFHGNSESYLKLNKIRPVTYILLVVLLVLAIQPLVGAFSHINQQIVFPESLAGVESKFREWEDMSSRVVERFIADKSFIGIVSNIFIIAILAAFVEEIFFRGCLQQIIRKIVVNKHATVWITAVIFSAIHFEFYGFLPRILLGAMLGYLYIWSGSLWIPIIAHLANNLGSIIIQQIYYGTPEYEELKYYDFQNEFLYLILSLIATIGIVYVLLKKYKTAI